jgi:DNA-binding transcriptional MerR regulator
MAEPNSSTEDLPSIPGKRYFTIGEVSELCNVKPHVLRYWEQEFPQLNPVKRRGNRRYYQRADVETIRQIRSLADTAEVLKRTISDLEEIKGILSR